MLPRQVLKDPLNHMRIGDISRRPPAMTRNLPPQCRQRLRAPQRSIANTRWRHTPLGPTQRRRRHDIAIDVQDLPFFGGRDKALKFKKPTAGEAQK